MRVLRLTFGLLATLWISPALAQQAAIQALEPQRFALVIGNGAYTASLSPLGSPCHHDPRHPESSSPQDPPGDAEVMAKAFEAAGWQDVEKVCNLTRSELRDKIDAFVDRIAQTERAFGVIYYSGHGAQVRSRNYLFGVDADIDTSKELKAFKQNPDARLFGSGAVELESTFGPLNPFYGKAVVVIIDACRDNPLIKDLRQSGMHAVTYPTRIEPLDGIVFSFATKSGATAPDGGFQALSPFTQSLAKEITELASSPGVGIEELIAQTNTAVEIASRGDQKPRKVGELRRPPLFCLKGCPSKLVDWQTATDILSSDLISSADTIVARDARLAELQVALPRQLRAQPVRSRSGLQLADLSLPSSAAVNRAILDRAIEKKMASPVRGPVQAVDDYTRQFAIDVYWCEGDSRRDARMSNAQALKLRLQTLYSSKSPVPGFSLGAVRALPLNSAIASKQRIADHRILVDKDSAVERSWARAIQAASATKFEIQERTGGSSPDRISAFVCDGFDFSDPIDSVYFHAATGVSDETLISVKQGLSKSVNGINVILETEQVDKSPNLTQVRYFDEAQGEKAAQVATYLGSVLGHGVESRFFPEYKFQLGAKRVIEVWIGLRERPLQSSMIIPADISRLAALEL